MYKPPPMDDYRTDYDYDETWMQLQLSMSEGVMNAIHHTFRMWGRASRSEFWWWIIFAAVVYPCIEYLSRMIEFTIIAYIFLALLAVPTFTATVRRLHDTNHSAWSVLWLLVPVIGWIWLIMLLLAPSNGGQNDYGDQPNLVRSDQI